MRFRPLHDRVVVRRIEGEDKTKGGIIIPDTAKEKPQEGEVIAAGPGARDESGKLAAIQEHVGAHIDMNLRRMAPMPQEILERFDALVARQNQLGWHAPVCGVMRP